MSRVVVLGGGESGVGAAVLASIKGHDTFLTDCNMLQEDAKAMLERFNIPYEEGGHTKELILNADEVIKSPGIPDTVPIVEEITENGIPIISEIEFAGRYDKAKKICITGSNGKTTTTSIIYFLLKNAGLNVGLAGNIGQSYAFQVATREYDYYVLELSSFQLDGMYDFKADIAVLLNITPDHLDRYDNNMENYIKAKFRITRNMSGEDCFIFCADLHIKNEVLRESLTSFKGVEHRLENVIKVKNVLYINDSKATNVNSTWYALESMKTPVIWIAGGKDKGNEYEPLYDLVKDKVRVLICLGIDNNKLHKEFADKVDEIYDAGSAVEAVDIAYRLAKSGETVLLSPACASFDLFKNYEDRGKQFKEAVAKL